MSEHPADLAGRYAVAVDERDPAALAAVFTADAELVLPPTLTGAGVVVTVGADAITEAILGAVAHLIGTRHEVYQVVVDVAGDTATGVVYCTAHHLYRGRDDRSHDQSVAIRYRDRHRRVDGRWLFARRELVVDFVENRVVTLP